MCLFVHLVQNLSAKTWTLFHSERIMSFEVKFSELFPLNDNWSHEADGVEYTIHCREDSSSGERLVVR